jgi:hypothetical protein
VNLFDSRSAVTAKRRLHVITNSELRSFRRCAREHYFRYVLRRRTVRVAEPLRIGTLLHIGLEVWFRAAKNGQPEIVRLELAIARVRSERADPFERVKVEAMLIGYTARWGQERLEVLAVEVEFRTLLRNPNTGAVSTEFELGGKLDAVVRLPDGRIAIYEHKSTSDEIAAGADYWRRVETLDSQASTYHVGARALGFDVACAVFDVIRKPGQIPLRATPVENRKYTVRKDKACPECKKKSAPPPPHRIEIGEVEGEPTFAQCVDGRVVTDPGGRLHANQRDADETPEEYRQRILESIQENPAKFFGRREVVRLEQDEHEAALDTWHLAELVDEAERFERRPRNPDACIVRGRTCDYFEVCSGETPITNDQLYRTAETAHEELGVEELP